MRQHPTAVGCCLLLGFDLEHVFWRLVGSGGGSCLSHLALDMVRDRSTTAGQIENDHDDDTRRKHSH